ncbi:S-formylglutathione hydrolase [Thalassotalea sp. LPB0316]|uniref:S-formylglutathione hydrolase n=1 Tax=Thalassotalea sp. LPB0316 TaxID=2769490 RepID=UPI001865BE2A|nr:S-formylglutathione hydrolase [Thalassotalea sp. LPB0316]QOL24987.1 S-formylglutathione hydrolase [Thalassotalea sp. LPB0316]
MLEKLSENKAFGGIHQQYRHQSASNKCQMRFAIYLPPKALAGEKVPVLYWLSGLTCSDENFMQKAGAFRVAAELGIAIVAPDTSPRGEGVPDDDNYDLGQGAGFYVNATQAPWAEHFQMYDYITQELPSIIEQHFPVTQKKSISGHSMGGHGALMIGLRNSDAYQSISAFSPIVNPENCPWGRKAFTAYLGEHEQDWRQYDSCELLKANKRIVPTLIDQGDADQFLTEQLQTPTIVSLAQQFDLAMQIRMQPGYDHSYYFISSFIEDHLRFHAQNLAR